MSMTPPTADAPGLNAETITDFADRDPFPFYQGLRAQGSPSGVIRRRPGSSSTSISAPRRNGTKAASPTPMQMPTPRSGKSRAAALLTEELRLSGTYSYTDASYDTFAGFANPKACALSAFPSTNSLCRRATRGSYRRAGALYEARSYCVRYPPRPAQTATRGSRCTGSSSVLHRSGRSARLAAHRPPRPRASRLPRRWAPG